MKKTTKIAIAAAGACGLYLAAICPRLKGRPDFSDFYGKVFAHRGMFGGKIAENSLEAFAKAVDNGYGIELDVQVSGDGQAVVYHDYTILRLFGEGRAVSSMTAEELAEYGIPTLRQALDVIDGKVPLIIELKCDTRDISICPIVAEVLDEYVGPYCIESFNPSVLKWFKDCRPDVIRGQIATTVKESGKGIKFLPIETLTSNFITRPDFIAYDHRHAGNLSLRICRKLYNTPVVAWTLETADQWSNCADKFDAFICEGLPKKRAKK